MSKIKDLIADKEIDKEIEKNKKLEQCKYNDNTLTSKEQTKNLTNK